MGLEACTRRLERFPRLARLGIQADGLCERSRCVPRLVAPLERLTEPEICLRVRAAREDSLSLSARLGIPLES
eukprot:scaffold36690_cov30-Tisochrysis_lutea.AAC.4